jgi:hypothetical protein
LGDAWAPTGASVAEGVCSRTCEWGEDFEIDSDTPLDAWLAERRKYEELKELK